MYNTTICLNSTVQCYKRQKSILTTVAQYVQLDLNFHLVYIRPFVGHLQLTINKYKGNPDIMTKYITRI